ncbi:MULTISPECIES: hypothetical protein [Thermomonas]|jgi:hypothetical protein|uniref:hypothetical protein n=1 Tax=Thermomonas TaxID=141948 RepID=UPI0012EB6027|nr:MULTISPECIES: hypothetical protein [Thermomonas]
MPSSAPTTVDELGLQGCLYLWALLTGQEHRLPIAQTKRMSLVVMAYLHERSVIEVPWPDAQWEIKLDAKTTPIEGLQWRLAWTVYEPTLLIDALDDYFDTLARDDFTTAARLRIWMELGSAEAERFFEQQLVKHRFSGDWAQDIAFAYRESAVVLTLAQWRYCAWAAVRRGASMALQHGLQADGLRDTIYQEIRRRAASVANGAWTGCSFPPYNPQPESALGRGFVHRLTRLGPLYWTGWPSVEVLLGHAIEGPNRLGVS